MKLNLVLSVAVAAACVMPTEATFGSLFGGLGSTPSYTQPTYSTSAPVVNGEWWKVCSNTWNLPQKKCPFDEGKIIKCTGRTTYYKIANGKKCGYSADAYALFKPVATTEYDCRVIDTCDNGDDIQPFKWQTGEWSECNCDGKQTRTVICTDKISCTAPGAIHQPQWCLPANNPFCGSQPIGSQSCKPNTQKCQTYQWFRSEGQCSATCGEGTKPVTVVCKSSTGQVVDDSKCSTSKPSTTPVPCSCGVKCETYQWFTSEGQCSVTCGQGTKPVHVVCKSSSGQVVDDTKCAGQQKPSTTPVACNTGVVCLTYCWHTRLSECSATCGAGTRTTIAECKDSNGKVVDDSKCSADTKPATPVVQCSAPVACETYQWFRSEGQCSATCGEGTKPVTVVCKSSTGQVVDDKKCSGVKPSTSPVPCNCDVKCDTFSWFRQEGQCSVTCGEGTKPVVAVCKSSSGQVVDNSKCADQQKPSTTPVPCNPGKACLTYCWHTRLTECSVSCGSGSRTTIAECKDSAGNVVDDNKCAKETKPATPTVACSAPVACETYQWFRSEGQCSATCGEGTKPVTVVCKSSTGQVVDDKKCSGVKPSTSPVPCNCGVKCPTYHWVIHRPDCSVTCGQGVINVHALCKDANDSVVDDKLCDAASIPQVHPEVCNAGKCTSVTGDPQFIGLRGQSYQVHGVDKQVYNIISDAKTQLNSRFVFLNRGKCAFVDSKKLDGCWTHPGSYLGEIGLKNGNGDKFYLKSGSAEQGFETVQVNGVDLSVGQMAEGCKFINTHEVAIETENYSFVFQNSDYFINQQVEAKDFDRLEQEGAHGLLGVTIHGKIYNENKIKYIPGEVSSYIVTENDVFGADYAYNLYD